MKRSIVIFISVCLVIGILIILVSNHQDEKIGDSFSESVNSTVGESKDCNVEFTEYLIDPKYVQKIGQIGVVHGSGKNIVERSYISVKEEFWNEEIKIPIYAPANMTFIAGAHYKISPDPEYIPDYALKFEFGCDMEMVLGHLKDVAPSIGEQLTELKQDSREDYLTPVDLKAGDLIGYYIQQEKEGEVSGFDFITRNKSFANKFINQERYEDGRAENLLRGVCPYDFYTGEKKESYYNLFGGGGGTIFSEKDCGNASRDKAGTISGMWFLDKEIVGSIYDYYMDGDYGSPISIVGDEERVAIGNIGQISSQVWAYNNNPTYKMPTEITSEHCYQLYPNPSDAEGFVYFKIIDDETMDVSYSSSGTCPSTFPSESKRYYK